MRKASAFLVATLLFLAAGTGVAQDWAKATLDKSPRHGEWVQLKHDDRTVSAFVVYPEVKGKASAVVVIHEIFGMTEWVQTVADQLAANGYIAIAPDLLSGMGPNGGRTSAMVGSDGKPDNNMIREAISKLPPDQITADLNAAADYVKKLPASNGKVSVAGFCWGGSQSFRFATNRPDLTFAAVFYGTAPDSGIERIKAPVYGFYAGNDARVGATVAPTQKMMEDLSKKYDPVTYKGAGHGFMRAGEAPAPKDDAAADQKTMYTANKDAHDEAWKRWLGLLKKQ